MEKRRKIRYLRELHELAAVDPFYVLLCQLGSSNLGGPGEGASFRSCYSHLEACIFELEEGTEEGVVAEVNFVLDIAQKKWNKGERPVQPAAAPSKGLVPPNRR